jgi:hypothetical protein
LLGVVLLAAVVPVALLRKGHGRRWGSTLSRLHKGGQLILQPPVNLADGNKVRVTVDPQPSNRPR